mgnify:FL=1
MDADRELAIASHTPPEAKGLFGDALETVLPGSGTPASDGQSDIVDPASEVEITELLPSDSLAVGGDVEGALSASDKLELSGLAASTLKRVLSGENPPRNAGVQVTASTAILDRVWPKQTAGSTISVAVQVNGGAFDRWLRRNDNGAAAS